MNKKPLIIAHRGASDHAPENTMKSFALAASMGADMIELDVHLTRDGVAVVNHDADLAYTTPPKGKIKNLPLEEIRSARFHGEPIPTLEEAILFCRDKGIEMDIECKDEAAIGEIVRLVRAHGMEQRTLISDFRIRGLITVRRLDTTIRTGYLTAPVIYPLAFPAALAAGAYSVNPHKFQVNKVYVELAHRLGLKVFPWTINRTDELRRMINLGVDGIITNRPDLLAKIISSMS